MRMWLMWPEERSPASSVTLTYPLGVRVPFKHANVASVTDDAVTSPTRDIRMPIGEPHHHDAPARTAVLVKHANVASVIADAVTSPTRDIRMPMAPLEPTS